MKGCNQWTKDRECIYTKKLKKTKDLERIIDNRKPAHMGTLFLYSAI